MIKTPRNEDDWDDWSEDDNDFDNDYDDESTPVLKCPNCGQDVYEEANQCPSCGEFIVPDTNAWESRPWWWVVLGLAGIIAVIVILSGLFRGF